MIVFMVLCLGKHITLLRSSLPFLPQPCSDSCTSLDLCVSSRNHEVSILGHFEAAANRGINVSIGKEIKASSEPEFGMVLGTKFKVNED